VKNTKKKQKLKLDSRTPSCYYVYMLLLSNGSFYTGYTVDVDKRVYAHVSGRGSKCVRAFPPQKILCVWKSPKRNEAMSVEALVKRMSRAEKELIVEKPLILCRLMAKKGFALKEVKRYRGLSARKKLTEI
jgi:putative endonuclease